eukprot:2079351-Amphidinium_carterae.1
MSTHPVTLNLKERSTSFGELRGCRSNRKGSTCGRPSRLIADFPGIQDACRTYPLKMMLMPWFVAPLRPAAVLRQVHGLYSRHRACHSECCGARSVAAQFEVGTPSSNRLRYGRTSARPIKLINREGR